jgi:hypothetical protein
VGDAARERADRFEPLLLAQLRLELALLDLGLLALADVGGDRDRVAMSRPGNQPA